MSSEINFTLLSRLCQNFQKLLQNPSSNYDTIINVGDESNKKTFYAHSIILTSQSDYFQVALSSDWVKRDGDKIIFNKPNITPKQFEIILK